MKCQKLTPFISSANNLFMTDSRIRLLRFRFILPQKHLHQQSTHEGLTMHVAYRFRNALSLNCKHHIGANSEPFVTDVQKPNIIFLDVFTHYVAEDTM